MGSVYKISMPHVGGDEPGKTPEQVAAERMPHVGGDEPSDNRTREIIVPYAPRRWG